MINSLYIHIPFCATKCSYCSFNSYAGLEALQDRYVECLLAEMEGVASGATVEPLCTMFLGGGTPSVLPASLLIKLLGHSSRYFPCKQSTEISMEINPGTVDLEKLDCLKRAGINRISFGVQSFIDTELAKINRMHSSQEAMAAIGMAQSAGFDNVSLDLMYGLPGQTQASWRQSLETAISLGVKHLSLYQLTVEEKTPMHKMVVEGRIMLPDEDILVEMDEITRGLTIENGLLQYEISNYAQTGFQCRHNIAYWENAEYYGFGAGAVSCVGGCRKRNIADPLLYCEVIESGRQVVIEEETLESEASFRETVIMGLRMNRGVSLLSLRQRYEKDVVDYYGETLQALIAAKLIEQGTDYLFLTQKGRVFANVVMAELV